MATFLENVSDQQLQVAGSREFAPLSMVRALAERTGKRRVVGVIGDVTVAASISFTITGGTSYSFTPSDLFRLIVFTAGANAGLIVQITQVVSATDVEVIPAFGGTPVPAVGITASVHNASNLEDDLNYLRLDELEIKGTTNWYDPVPVYQRPDANLTDINANLTNLAGKGLDSKAIGINCTAVAQTVTAGDLNITIASPVIHAAGDNETGIPIFSIPPYATNYAATFVEITNPATNTALKVQSGTYAGESIYGRVTGGVSGSDISIQFRSGANDGSAGDHPYPWEATQPMLIDIFYLCIKRMDNLDINDLRTTLVGGIIGDAAVGEDINQINQFIGRASGQTAPILTNTSPNYIFGQLLTPSDSDLEEAVNFLNQEIGDRSYTGTILTDDETIVSSLQALANNIAAVSPEKIIDRSHGGIAAGSVTAIPGALTYVLDPTGSAKFLDILVAGVLLSPDSAPATPDGEYQEVSTTTIKWRFSVGVGQDVTYIIRA